MILFCCASELGTPEDLSAIEIILYYYYYYYYYYSNQPIFGLTQEWLREFSFSRLECGVHDKLHLTSRVPVEGKSSLCVICMKYRIIVLIIIIISLGLHLIMAHAWYGNRTPNGRVTSGRANHSTSLASLCEDIDTGDAVAFFIGVNRPFGGTVPHFHQMSREMGQMSRIF